MSEAGSAVPLALGAAKIIRVSAGTAARSGRRVFLDPAAAILAMFWRLAEFCRSLVCSYASYPCANRDYSSEERLLRPMAGVPGDVRELGY